MTSKEKARAQRLEKFFNLTIEEWNKIATYQRFCCAVCCGTQPSGKNLATDHDHDIRGTGLVRGLLCNVCNRALGRIERSFRKDTDIVQMLLRLAKFLADPPATKALGREIHAFPGRFGTKRHKKFLADLKKLKPQ